MRIHDTCKCGSVFRARGVQVNVIGAWVTWLNSHAICRGDKRQIDFKAD